MFLAHKIKTKKQKNSKRPKHIRAKQWLENRNDRSACVNIFSVPITSFR